MNDLADRLTNTQREQRWPNRRPLDAASLIVLDTRAGTPHVLMGRRRPDLKFMPGKYVFPGGRVDRGDGSAPVAAPLKPETEARLLRHMKGRPTTRRAKALAMAAVRETYEETGLLIGSPGEADTTRYGDDWAEFLGHGVLPRLDRLSYVLRAITPPRRPRRFDTRFFAVTGEDIADELPEHLRPSEELDALKWIALDEAATLDIPTITGVVLDELKARINGPGGLTSRGKIPFYHVIRGKFVRELL